MSEKTVREQHESDEFPVAGVIGLAIAIFVGGIVAHGTFIAPAMPLPDLKAEYCRGLADGDAMNYFLVYEGLVQIENRIEADGLLGGLAVVNPSTGLLVQPLVDMVGEEDSYFPPATADKVALQEKACNVFDMDRLIAQFPPTRGPSNHVATTAP